MKNMRLRRLLYETNGTNVVGSESLENPLMKIAFSENCFQEKGFEPTKNQTKGQTEDIETQYPWSKGEAFLLISTNPELADKKNIFLIPNSDGKTFRASYRDDSYIEKEVQEAIHCPRIEPTVNPIETPDQKMLMDVLTRVGFKKYQDVTGVAVMNHTLVDVAKDSYVINTVLKGSDQLLSYLQSKLRTFLMWKEKTNYEGTEQQALNKGKFAEDLIDYLKKLTPPWVEGPPRPGEGDLYVQLDLSKPESYNYPELKDYNSYIEYFKGPFIMSKPKLTPDADKLLKTLRDPKYGSYVPLKSLPFETQMSGEVVKIDLSDPKQYVGNLSNLSHLASQFPKGYTIAKKLDISLEGGSPLNQETCRVAIEEYYNKMMQSPSGTSPSLEEKRRVEKCLNTFKGRYPKLKDKIEKLIYVPRDKTAFRIAQGDYTSGGALNLLRPKSKTVIDTGQTTPETTPEQNVQQESRDRLLKNIISENLLKLKKKQLLERTLSSRNTYRY